MLHLRCNRTRAINDLPGDEAGQWLRVFAPAGTPADFTNAFEGAVRTWNGVMRSANIELE